MGGIVDSMPYWLGPLIGGIGSGLQHGGGAEGRLVPAWGTDPDSGRRFAPTVKDLWTTAYGGVLRPLGETIGTQVGLMRSPIILDRLASPQTIPGVDTGFGQFRVTGKDPAQLFPSSLGRGGLNVGATLGQPFDPTSTAFGTIPQAAPPRPIFGGGVPEVQNALNLLTESKIDQETFSKGLWDAGQMFTGANIEGNGELRKEATCPEGQFWDVAESACMPINITTGDPRCREINGIPVERWDENLQTCVPIVFDDPTNTPEGDQGGAPMDYDSEGYPTIPQSGVRQSNQTPSSHCADLEVERQAQCIAEGGRWIPGSPVSGSGGRPCGGYCQ